MTSLACRLCPLGTVRNHLDRIGVRSIQPAGKTKPIAAKYMHSGAVLVPTKRELKIADQLA